MLFHCLVPGGGATHRLVLLVQLGSQFSFTSSTERALLGYWAAGVYYNDKEAGRGERLAWPAQAARGYSGRPAPAPAPAPMLQSDQLLHSRNLH